MIILFCGFLTVIVYVYFGYPLFLESGLLGRRRPIRRKRLFPRISILVPAHDEQAVIGQKLDNLMALDYPRELLEVLVGNDGSMDGTAEIVSRYAAEGVKLINSPTQRGKSAIENDLVEHSNGSILIFTDADCEVPINALKLLAEPFADEGVGLVTVRPCYLNAEETSISENEGLYWRYENWLRLQESERGLLATASGGLFGIRRSLWRPLEPTLGDDFVLPLGVCLQGYRNVVVPELRVRWRLAQVHTLSLLRMRMRIVSKDLRGLLSNWHVLDPFRAGPVAIGLWSHKLLRWLVPYFLLGLLVSNLFLLEHIAFRILLGVQLLFYGFALAGVLRGERQMRIPWSVPFSFCLVNTAAFLGTLHCAMGRTIGHWRPDR